MQTIFDNYKKEIIQNPRKGISEAVKEIRKKYNVEIVYGYSNLLKEVSFLLFSDELLSQITDILTKSSISISLESITNNKDTVINNKYNIPQYIFKIEMPNIFSLILPTSYNNSIIEGELRRSNKIDDTFYFITYNYPYNVSANFIKKQIIAMLTQSVESFVDRGKIKTLRSLFSKWFTKFYSYDYKGCNKILNEIFKDTQYTFNDSIIKISNDNGYNIKKILTINPVNTRIIADINISYTIQIDYSKLTSTIINKGKFTNEKINSIKYDILHKLNKPTKLCKVSSYLSTNNTIDINIHYKCCHLTYGRDGKPYIKGEKRLSTIERHINSINSYIFREIYTVLKHASSLKPAAKEI